MRRAAVASAVLVLAFSGCGGGSSNDGGAANGETAAAGGAEGELSVAQAKENAGTGLKIRGFVFVREDEDSLICNGLDTTSYPPVCLEPSLKVANPAALADVKLSKGVGQAGGLQWAERPVSLTGDVAGDAVTVSEITKP